MNLVTYQDRVAEQELQILRSILSEIDKQKESFIESSVAQALSDENRGVNVFDDINSKLEKAKRVATDAMATFHQSHPEYYAVQKCPHCGMPCFYKKALGVLDEATRIEYECESCGSEFEKETGYWNYRGI